MVLFGYGQMALSADATFEFLPNECDNGLLPIILLCLLPFVLNPILGGLWNYVTGWGGIMARMDSSHPEAVSRRPKAQH